jgi:hypothetical protein
MDRTSSPPSAYNLNEAEWEVLYLLYDALDQLRKMTLSFSELRYLAVEHTEAQVRAAVLSLLQTDAPPGGPTAPQLISQVPNLAGLPIYRITPYCRDIVQQQQDQGRTQGVSPPPGANTRYEGGERR